MKSILADASFFFFHFQDGCLNFQDGRQTNLPLFHEINALPIPIEPVHEISNNVVCATSKA